MKILYLVIAVLLIYTIGTVVRFKYILYTSHLNTIVQHDQKFGNGDELKYIAAGDSTAVGVGASSVEHSYPYLIAQDLSSSHTVEYKNVGVTGAKTSDVINNQLSQIIKFQPDIITLSIGGNDVTHLRNPNDTVSNLKTIINTLTEQTRARIYITNIPIVEKAPLLPYVYRKFLQQRLIKINHQMAELENDRVRIIDIHEFGWKNYPDIKSTFAEDQFHPNDVGYRNWADAFLSKINSQP